MTAAGGPEMPDDPGEGKRPPLFLERQSYRRRRLTDAARLLPLLGVALFLVPLFWSGGGGDDGVGAVGPSIATSRAIVFIFGTWAFLIVAAALLGKGLKHLGRRGGGEAPGDG